MTRGRVIVLNGPSSAGKTTLAKAVRAHVGPRVAAVSIDQFFAFMHPDARHDWHQFSTLTETLLASVVALSNGGFDVIADTVFERSECLAATQRMLADRWYRLVAVTSPVEVLEEREHARGNRRLGQAREQHGRVLHGASYDLTVDTHALTTRECVERVAALFATTH
jgi:chloramphenicol 3-O phosphotransferase